MDRKSLPQMPPPKKKQRLTAAEIMEEENEQRAKAVAQWSTEEESDPKETDNWIKSWYFPYEEFSPWPEKRTKLKCWWCTYPFDWSPFPLPWSYNKVLDKYRVTGIFCGPSCAKSYSAMYDMDRNGRVNIWIDSIAKKYYGYDIFNTPIKLAPRKELLKDYCGPHGMTIEEFRSVCQHGRTLRLQRPGFITIKQVIEAEQYVARSHCGTSHIENPDRMQSTKELTTTKREVFVGKGVRRLSDFAKRK